MRPAGAADAAAAPRAAVIARLEAEIHAVLGPLVPPRGQPFALLDFPDHGNVGDSAIYAGEIAYFARRHRTRPSFVYGFGSRDIDWDRLFADLGPEAPVFIHGGGNFGDVWPGHQAFREQVFARARDRRVVQLPQSIHFSNAAAVARTAEAIAAHGNVLLLVRDRPSLDLARQHFACEVRLCPDMAFCLGVLDRIGTPRHDVLVLARTDHETVAGASAAGVADPPGVATADWLAEPAGFRSGMRWRSGLHGLFSLGPRAALDGAAQRELLYRRLSTVRVKRGLALLSEGRRVATDRLHAHILCLLLGIPHAVADNSYGKIARFMDAWGTDIPSVRRAASLAAAIATARDLPA